MQLGEGRQTSCGCTISPQHAPDHVLLLLGLVDGWIEARAARVVHRHIMRAILPEAQLYTFLIQRSLSLLHPPLLR